MIKNERQYRITKAQAEKFERAVAAMELAAPAPDVHPLFHKAQVDAMKGQLKELRLQLEEYERLRSGKTNGLEIASFEELPMALIKARIASGLTQDDLAAKFGLKSQQIQRYEATNYTAASLRRIMEVINVLDSRPYSL